MTKSNAEKGVAFVDEHVILQSKAQAGKAKVFFVDEAHLRAKIILCRK